MLLTNTDLSELLDKLLQNQSAFLETNKTNINFELDFSCEHNYKPAKINKWNIMHLLRNMRTSL